ncbi:11087_t:CDS:2 [Dentiscutata erythropus]|uniref:11087_t:CDS:1 n=1 Tax=Dentiscutata erythropus TaxID=1348616 RepID=A0A9N9C3I2_9GLOM|nr:11087_t:CDS:2 [Dentiscutata erythropus]
MKLASKINSLSRLKLIKLAKFLSILTILWNVIEGLASVFFGAQHDSVSLFYFGFSSFIEIAYSCTVLWRFLKESASRKKFSTKKLIVIERRATIIIGILFILLAIETIAAAIYTLVKKGRPDTAFAGLGISSISILFLSFLWYLKLLVAKRLNSSTMMSDAKCTLSWIKITLVIFFGSFIYAIWRGGWWIDSTSALVLGLFFAKGGIQMILWAKNKDFDGGYYSILTMPSEDNITISSEKFIEDNITLSSEKIAEDNVTISSSYGIIKDSSDKDDNITISSEIIAEDNSYGIINDSNDSNNKNGNITITISSEIIAEDNSYGIINDYNNIEDNNTILSENIAEDSGIINGSNKKDDDNTISSENIAEDSGIINGSNNKEDDITISSENIAENIAEDNGIINGSNNKEDDITISSENIAENIAEDNGTINDSNDKEGNTSISSEKIAEDNIN